MADANINHQNSLEYWQNIDADVNGMLGGFPYVSKVDLQGSRNFLAKLGMAGGKKKDDDGTGKRIERAVDCGAGIGRITEGLLLSLTTTVDIVEPISKFSNVLKSKPGIGQIYNVGLEEWTPSVPYDLIWNQWCLGHLTDAQLVTYLAKCGRSLTEGGLVIVKENLSSSEVDIFDELDSSVTRTDEKFRLVFEQAGLRIKKTEIQKGLPKDLYLVRTYALVPNV